jgi:shikimate kinase
MSNYRPLLPAADYSALRDGLQKERNPWFAEVARFTINSDNGDIERDAKRVVEVLQYNLGQLYFTLFFL